MQPKYVKVVLMEADIIRVCKPLFNTPYGGRVITLDVVLKLEGQVPLVNIMTRSRKLRP
jgi:hypothetical protein